VGGVGGQVRARSPGEFSAVSNGVGQGLDGLDVGGGTAEKDQRDGTSGGGSPLDGVGLALRNDLVQARGGNGIAGGILGVVRIGEGGGQGHEGGESGGGGETHVCNKE
jgi:hypothetical protein